MPELCGPSRSALLLMLAALLAKEVGALAAAGPRRTMPGGGRGRPPGTGVRSTGSGGRSGRAAGRGSGGNGRLSRRQRESLYEREQWGREDDLQLLAADRRRKRRPVYGEVDRWGTRRTESSSKPRSYGDDVGDNLDDDEGYGGGNYGSRTAYNPAISQSYQQRGGGRNAARYMDTDDEDYPKFDGYNVYEDDFSEVDLDGKYPFEPDGEPAIPLKSWESEAANPEGGKGFFSDRTFESVGASEEMVAALRSVGASTPSHVQALGYKKVLGEGDTILADQTGSGKTLAYLAPVVQTLREAERTDGRTESTMVRALVLVPTAELAQQVLRVARSLSMGGAPFRSAIVTGEHKWATQKKAAQAGLELLVVTPGRLAAHLSAEPPSFSLADLRHVILDEVDVLYEDPDFDEIWRMLRAKTPARASHTFVTATLPPPVEDSIRRNFPLAKAIKGPGLHQTRAGVRQKLIDCSAGADKKNGWTRKGSPIEDVGFQRKMEALLSELRAEPSPQTLVFCNTIESCRRVENALRRRDRRGREMDVAAFHAALTPPARKQALEKLIGAGQDTPDVPVVLVCTDRASRGMDFPAVGHVILFDFPRDGVEYVRRVGRATRGGNAPGRVTSLALGRQLAYAKALMTANARGERIDMDTHAG